jgi:hypothetical protein
MALPMIIISPIPGQEERNADFLLEAGVALKAVDAASLEYKVKVLLDDPARGAMMRERMSAYARPGAAANVLRLVCGAHLSGNWYAFPRRREQGARVRREGRLHAIRFGAPRHGNSSSTRRSIHT